MSLYDLNDVFSQIDDKIWGFEEREDELTLISPLLDLTYWFVPKDWLEYEPNSWADWEDVPDPEL